jgi:hypothetical protein
VSGAVTTDSGQWAKVPVWVLTVGLSGAELAVYVSLRSYADRHGDTELTVRAIARRAGVVERTAERAIARMRDLGLLATTKTTRPDGSYAGCHYHLRDVPTPAEAATAASENDAAMSPPPDEDVATPPTRMSEPKSHLSSSPALPSVEDPGDTPAGRNPISDDTLIPEPATPPPSGRSPRRAPERPLPQDWNPTEHHHQYAREHALDLNHESYKFRAHADTNDRRARNWDAAFRTWLANAVTFAQRGRPAGQSASEHELTDAELFAATAYKPGENPWG